MAFEAMLGCQPTPVRLKAPPATMPSAHGEVDALVNAWHEAASRADEEAYFACFASEAVFLGTDPGERWDKTAFRAYAHPHFARGKAWNFTPIRREVVFAPSGDVAWFDEDLDTPNLGRARGSGVLVREAGHFRIAHYDLSIPIPNEQLQAVKPLIQAPASSPPPR